MELKAVACGNCGAPLQVPDTVRFLNCNHCGSSLEIKHTESVTYSERIAQIDERTERIEQKLEVLELQSELARLDSAWQVTREKFMVTNKHGHKSIPRKSSAFVGAVVTTVIGFVMFVVGARSFQAKGMAIGMGMGMIFVAGGAILAAVVHAKASAYEAAERRYRSNRRQVDVRLAVLRGEPSPLPSIDS